MSSKNISYKRHLAKTVTWRIIATIDTILLSWLVTGEIALGLAIGGLEVLTKMVLYYLHERTWYKSKFGIKKELPYINGNSQVSETNVNSNTYRRPGVFIHEYD